MKTPRSAIALILLSGCMTWSPIPSPAPDSGGITHSGAVRIVMTDSFQVAGRDVLADTQLVRYTRGDGVRDSLPRRAVARIEQRKFDPKGTAVLVGVSVAIGLAMGALMEDMFVMGGTGGTIY